MKIAKFLPCVLWFFLAGGMSYLTAGQLPACSANAPCFTVADRQSSAGLAVRSLYVKNVYQNGRQLTNGVGADYQMVSGANGKIMVIVHMPANTTGNAEVFQVTYK